MYLFYKLNYSFMLNKKLILLIKYKIKRRLFYDGYMYVYACVIGAK